MRTRFLALLLLAAPAFTPGQAPADQNAPAEAARPTEGPPTELPPPPPATTPAPPTDAPGAPNTLPGTGAPPTTNAPPLSSAPQPTPPAPAPPAAPPASAYPPSTAAPPAAPLAAAPRGQWVYTDQYGWLWMPYGRRYTYIPADPRVFPDMYVYYPVYGWRWVVAPWVYGYGPAPYWGAPGPRYFAWYSRPWFRVGGYWGWGGYRTWGHYSGWVGPPRWGPRGWASAPAYYRSGVGGPHPAHVFRAHPEPKRARPEHHGR